MQGYLKILYNYIYARVPEPENIDDIMQETLFSAWQGIGAYQAASSFKTWLLAIANNKINDFFRNRYRRQTETLEGKAEIAGAFDFTLRVAEKNDVQKALLVLSEEEKRLVHLIFNVRLSYGEITRLTGIPEGTVKSRMFAIKAKLKKTLGGKYHG